MKWKLLHPRATLEMLGFLPDFLNEDDPEPARTQLDLAYAHGGGWRPFKGFRLAPNGDLLYPGDPPIKAIAQTRLREEIIRIYEHGWVCIIQPDNSYEIARMD